MKAGALIDAGPLVALLNRRDEHHAWATEQIRSLTPPLRTCEAALAEAMHLLESRANNGQTLRRMLAEGILVVNFSLRVQLAVVLALMDRYANVPMSLADACLVRMCELDEQATLLTTDGDFLVYRMNGRDVLPLVMPPRNPLR